MRIESRIDIYMVGYLLEWGREAQVKPDISRFEVQRKVECMHKFLRLLSRRL